MQPPGARQQQRGHFILAGSLCTPAASGVRTNERYHCAIGPLPHCDRVGEEQAHPPELESTCPSHPAGSTLS